MSPHARLVKTVNGMVLGSIGLTMLRPSVGAHQEIYLLSPVATDWVTSRSVH